MGAPHCSYPQKNINKPCRHHPTPWRTLLRPWLSSRPPPWRRRPQPPPSPTGTGRYGAGGYRCPSSLFGWNMVKGWFCYAVITHHWGKMHVKSLIVLMGHVWGHVWPKKKWPWSRSPLWSDMASFARAFQSKIALTREIVFTRDFSVEIAKQFFTKKSEKKDFWEEWVGLHFRGVKNNFAHSSRTIVLL